MSPAPVQPAPSEPTLERRRSRRHDVALECRIDGLSRHAFVRLTDLSLEGGYVDTPANFRVGDFVKIAVTLDGVEVEFTALIAHARRMQGFGFSINADNLPAATRRALSSFLERHSY